MIKILDENTAKSIWDSTIIELSNYTYYQSFENAMVQKENDNISFVSSVEGEKKIYGFLVIFNDYVKFPFGPVVSESVNYNDLMEFINEVGNSFNKDVIFSTTEKMENDIYERYPFLEKNWLFITPLIDTSLSIEQIMANCNENRRRIIRKGLINIPCECLKDGIEYADDFYKLYQKRMNEIGICVDFTKESLYRHLSFSSNKLIVCSKDSKIIAGHVIYKFGDTVITRYNCYDSDYAKISPAARIEFDVIKRCCENTSVNNYDMSGLSFDKNITPKDMGVNRYKESYGPTKIRRYQWYKYKI